MCESAPSETWLIIPNNPEGEPFEIKGKQLSRDKTDPRRSSGYVFYFCVDGEIVSYSGFHYTIKRIEEKLCNS